MRYQPDPQKLIPPRADRETQFDTGYTLTSLQPWYKHATTVSVSGEKATTVFEDKIHIGTDQNGEPLFVGRYIAGEDYDRSAWSRPKPPWSWDDKWDQVPIFLWHYYPSYAFSSHAEGRLSHNYLYNGPMEHTFNITDLDEILPYLELEMATSRQSKWDNLSWRSNLVGQKDLWNYLNYKLKQYVNYVFNGLG